MAVDLKFYGDVDYSSYSVMTDRGNSWISINREASTDGLPTKIVTERETGYGPFCMHFDTNAAPEIRRDSIWDWDFDDEGSTYLWTHENAKNANKARGFMSAHTFQAGTYTVKATMYHINHPVTTVEKTITIKDKSEVINDNNTIYVDPEGIFADVPSSVPTANRATNFAEAWNKGNSVSSGHLAILFRAGTEIPQGSETGRFLMRIPEIAPSQGSLFFYLGSYGEGDRPVILAPTPKPDNTTTMPEFNFMDRKNLDDQISLENIARTSNYDTVTGTDARVNNGFWFNPSHGTVTIHNCYVRGYAYGVLFLSGERACVSITNSQILKCIDYLVYGQDGSIALVGNSLEGDSHGIQGNEGKIGNAYYNTPDHNNRHHGVSEIVVQNKAYGHHGWFPGNPLPMIQAFWRSNQADKTNCRLVLCDNFCEAFQGMMTGEGYQHQTNPYLAAQVEGNYHVAYAGSSNSYSVNFGNICYRSNITVVPMGKALPQSYAYVAMFKSNDQRETPNSKNGETPRYIFGNTLIYLRKQEDQPMLPKMIDWSDNNLYYEEGNNLFYAPNLNSPVGLEFGPFNEESIYQVTYPGMRGIRGLPDSNAGMDVLDFRNGSNALPSGSTITGATSGATAEVYDHYHVETGSLASGDATGYVVLRNITGTFQNSENIRINGTNVAIVDGSLEKAGPQRRYASNPNTIVSSYEPLSGSAAIGSGTQGPVIMSSYGSRLPRPSTLDLGAQQVSS